MTEAPFYKPEGQDSIPHKINEYLNVPNHSSHIMPMGLN
jgi:hypothetical protein